MGLPFVATDAWASRTLATDEIWTPSNGVIFVDAESNEANRSGIPLSIGDSIRLLSGSTVYVRSGGDPVAVHRLSGANVVG